MPATEPVTPFATDDARPRNAPRSALLVSLALPLAAGMAAQPALTRFDGHLGRDVDVSLAVCTAALCFVLVRFALGSGSLGRLVLRLTVGGALLGSVNAGAVLAMNTVASHDSSMNVPVAFFMGCTFGSIFGAPLGLLFGLSFAPSLWRAVQSRLRPSLDSLEATGVAVGVLLVLVGLGGSLLGNQLVLVGSFGLLLLGVAVLAAALARDAVRLRFLRLARAGLRPDYRVRALEVGESIAALPLFRARGAEPEDEVLEHVVGHGVGPFRESARRTVLGVVSSRSLAVHTRVPLAALALLLAVLSLGYLVGGGFTAQAERFGYSYRAARLSRR